MGRAHVDLRSVFGDSGGPTRWGRAVTNPAGERSLNRVVEGVAAGRRAGLVAGPEPLVALLGPAVRPGLRGGPALRALLQPVVPDRGGRGQRGVDVLVGDVVEQPAALRVRALLGVVRPHAGIAVGL